MISEERKQYIKEHHAANYTRIVMDIRPEVKRRLQERADAAGMSLTSYLVARGLQEERGTNVAR